MGQTPCGPQPWWLGRALPWLPPFSPLDPTWPLEHKGESTGLSHLLYPHCGVASALRLGTPLSFASPAGLDIEFTGLRSSLSGPQQISLFDLPSEWYLKTRQSVQQFTICQIGLSVFSSIEGEFNKLLVFSF